MLEDVDSLSREIATQRSWSEIFDAEYSRPGLTDWEMLPLRNLGEVLSRLGPELASLRTAVEIGCGRGLRSLATLSTVEAFARADFSYWGIDLSALAIRTARMLAEQLALGHTVPEPFEGVLGRAALGWNRPLQAGAGFLCADLFEWLPVQPRGAFDLVIDWMCYHEIEPQDRAAYAASVARSCRRYFVINMFSREGSSASDLGLVAGLQKFQHSEADVRAVFGPHFEIIDWVQFPEDLDPHPRPTDGMVAAKRAYIMRRRT